MKSKSGILLFDIDGTLLSVPDKGMKIFTESIRKIFGPHIQLPHQSFSGKTDWEMYRDAARFSDISNHESDSKWLLFKEIYFEYFKEQVKPEDFIIHQNAGFILDYFSKKTEITTGILTGNIQQTANHKLEMTGLFSFIEFGIYGDDHWQREKLGELAIERISQVKSTSEESHQIFIIGDTPRDVDVAKHIQAVSICVTTGKHSEINLKNHGADFVIHNLIDAKSIIESYF